MAQIVGSEGRGGSVALTAITAGGVMSELRDRIAAAIYNSSDEYTRKLMVRPDCPGASETDGEWKPICYRWADAVIETLGLRPERGIPNRYVTRLDLR